MRVPMSSSSPLATSAATGFSAPSRYAAYMRDLQTRHWAYEWTPASPVPHLAGRTKAERDEMIPYRRGPPPSPSEPERPATPDAWSEA